LRLRWLGAGAVEVVAGGRTLLVDPFFTRPSIPRLLFHRLSSCEKRVAGALQGGDYVLITHSHYDHLMDVPIVHKMTGCAVYGSPNSLGLLRLFGLPEQVLGELHNGAQLALDPFEVDVLPGDHLRILGHIPIAGDLRRGLKPPLRVTDYRLDVCHNFLIVAQELRLLLWNGPWVEGALSADVLLVQPYFDTAMYQRLLNLVDPRYVIPIHWDDFTRPLSRPRRPMLKLPGLRRPWPRRMEIGGFRRQIQGLARHVEVLIPDILQPYDLGQEMSGEQRATLWAI
jgi:L-ascorbate metabolism protein UlaG (beta-lactamase superfamily)